MQVSLFMDAENSVAVDAHDTFGRYFLTSLTTASVDALRMNSPGSGANYTTRPPRMRLARNLPMRGTVTLVDGGREREPEGE